MTINKYIGSRIREFRKNLGKSQLEIAEYLAMSQSAYAKLETGQTSISTERIYKLCQLFNKPFKAFFPAMNSDSENRKLEVISEKVDESIFANDKYVQHLEEEVKFLRIILNQESKK